MASVNKVIIVGNLGADPEARSFPNGGNVTNLRIATTERYKDRDGNMQEQTEWHRVSLFNKLGEIAAQYLKKGASIYVEGRLRTRKYQDKDGRDVYATEIVGDQMQMLGGKPDSQQQGRQQDNGGYSRDNGGRAQRQQPTGGSNRGNQRDSGYGQHRETSGFSGADDDIPF